MQSADVMEDFFGRTSLQNIIEGYTHSRVLWGVLPFWRCCRSQTQPDSFFRLLHLLKNVVSPACFKGNLILQDVSSPGDLRPQTEEKQLRTAKLFGSLFGLVSSLIWNVSLWGMLKIVEVFVVFIVSFHLLRACFPWQEVELFLIFVDLCWLKFLWFDCWVFCCFVVL